MAIEWMENFQNYGSGSTGLNNMKDGLWAQVSSSTYNNVESDPDGVSSGRVFSIGPFGTTEDNGTHARRVFPSGSQTTAIVGQRWYFSALPNDAVRRPSFTFRDSNNDTQLDFITETTGVISVYRGDEQNNNLLGQTAIPVLTAGQWQYVEIKATIDDAAGSVEIKVAGVPVLTLTGVDTKATAVAGCAQLTWGRESGLSSNWIWYLKDIIVMNGTGSQNNDFIGDVQIVSLYPDADDSFNWAASTGTTGFNLIDETTANDADFISANDTPPAASSFTLDDLDPEVTAVKGLQLVGRLWKSDGGTGNAQMAITTNSATDTGGDKPLSVSATYYIDISETSPDTSVAWTPTEVNNAILSIDRTDV